MNNGQHVSWSDVLRICVGLLVTIAFVYYWSIFAGLLNALLAAASALIIGLAVAYVINIPLRYFTRILPESKRGLAMPLAVLSTLGLIVVALVVVLPQFIECVILLSRRAPQIVDDIVHNSILNSILPAGIQEQIDSIDWKGLVSGVVKFVQSSVTDFSMIGGVASSVGAVFMGSLFGVVYLSEKDQAADMFHRVVIALFGNSTDQHLREVTEIFDDSFRVYIVLRALTGTLIGVASIVIMLILGLPEAAMIGPLVGVLSLVPTIGTPLGAILGALLAVPYSWQKALIFLVLVIVVQQLVEGVVIPQILGRVVGLSGVLMLAGIIVGGGLWGIIGTFVGVPLMLVLQRIMDLWVEKSKESDGEPLVKRLRTRLKSID